MSEAIRTGKPYPVKGLIVQASNPFSNLSNTHDVYECIKKLELVVTHEYTMTPCAMLSDYVLPAAGWLERPQLWGVGGGGPCITGVALTGEAAVPPMYERRDNYEFWRSLAEGVFDEETVQKYWSWQTTEEAYDAMLAPQGTSARDAITNPVFNPSPEEWHKMSDPKTGELYGFGTPTGKVELYSTIIEKLFDESQALPYYEEPFESPVSTPEVAEDYPLIMTAGSRVMPYYHSEYRQVNGCRNRYPDPFFQIHPETAANLGIGDGMWCWIETQRGRCLQKAKPTPACRPTPSLRSTAGGIPSCPKKSRGWAVGSCPTSTCAPTTTPTTAAGCRACTTSSWPCATCIAPTTCRSRPCSTKAERADAA